MKSLLMMLRFKVSLLGAIYDGSLRLMSNLIMENQEMKMKIVTGGGICCLMAFLVFPLKTSYAKDLTECMTEMMTQVSEDLTIGELRIQCEKQFQDNTYSKKEETSAYSKRITEDKKHILEPFTLMSHKPNYILLLAHNANGYSPDLFREQYDDPSIEWYDSESQFQISIKTPLAVGLFDTVDLYGAYTNRSFWQVYNSDVSAPFRETNHEPEMWAQFNPNWELWGFTNSANMFGFVHQSNGRGGVLSRSWNRLYANFVVEKGDFTLSFKPWHRISEDDSDDNPDLTDYLGHYELRAAYKYKEHVVSAMSRNNLESGFEKGAVELSWSFPIWNYPYLKGYVQYFGGYGESLIDYDQKVNRIGIGFALTDWL